MQLEHERSRREKMEAKLDQYKLDNAYLMSQLQQLSESVCVFICTYFSDDGDDDIALMTYSSLPHAVFV